MELNKLKGEATRSVDAQMEELKREEDRLNGARSALQRDVLLFEQRQASAKGELMAAENVKVEIQALRNKLEDDQFNLNKKGEELHRLGVVVESKSRESEKRLRDAESVKLDGLNTSRTAIAAKNQLDIDREGLHEERKKMESDRLTMSHERMNLIRDQAASRSLNMKLSSAISVAGTVGGRGGWQPVVALQTNNNNNSNSNSNNRGNNGGMPLTKETMAGLRSQVNQLETNHNSSFVDQEKIFIERVKVTNEGGKGEEDGDNVNIAGGIGENENIDPTLNEENF